jgi:hypothetical protein
VKGNWQRDPNRSVSESIAALDGPDLWDEKVKRRLCEQARREKLARGAKTGGLQGFRYHDMETSEAIGAKRQVVVRREARELAEREIELQELYRSGDLIHDWEKITAICNEIDVLGARWDNWFELDGNQRERLGELRKQLKTFGVEWQKKAFLESLLEDFLYGCNLFTPEGGWGDILEPTRNYLNSPQVHTPWLTHFFLVRLIYLLKYPFERAHEEAMEGFWSPWKNPSIGLWWIVLLGILGLFYWRLSWPFWVVWALAAAWAFERRRHFLRSERLLLKLDLVYLEVEDKMFDPEESARRLRTAEESAAWDSGLYVPSLIYALLRLKQA